MHAFFELVVIVWVRIGRGGVSSVVVAVVVGRTDLLGCYAEGFFEVVEGRSWAFSLRAGYPLHLSHSAGSYILDVDIILLTHFPEIELSHRKPQSILLSRQSSAKPIVRTNETCPTPLSHSIYRHCHFRPTCKQATYLTCLRMRAFNAVQ